MKERITAKLTQEFKPTQLEIIDESELHSHHHPQAGKGGTHFKITIASDYLTSLSRIDAHRAINNLLVEEFKDGLHALSINII